MLLVDGPAHGILADHVVVLVHRLAHGIEVVADVLLVDRPAGGVVTFLHHGVIDGAIADPRLVLDDGMVADTVADAGQAALLGATAPDGVGTGPTVRRLRRMCQRPQSDQDGQRKRDLQPHL